MIIHLNGMPGVGKFTVAKLLSEKFNARLIDNHLLIDLARAVCGRGSAEYLAMLKKTTGIVLEQIANQSEQTFIFTNALSNELSEDRERLDYLHQFARDRNILFLQTLLICDLAENKQRIVSENRKLKGKILNPSELDEIYEKYSIYHPPTKFALTIDTTNLSAEEVSEQIKHYLETITNP